MSRASNKVVATAIAVGLLGAGATACSKASKGTETAQRAEKASGQMVRQDSVTATVEQVDEENRTVTLREPEGGLFTVEVGEGVQLEKMHPDDKVNVAYKESFAFELQEPGTTPKVQETSTTERLPEGVEFGRRVTTTVEILAVAPQGTAATFRGPEGDVRTVEVENPENQAKVSNLRPGDTVEVTYTEELAVQREQ